MNMIEQFKVPLNSSDPIGPVENIGYTERRFRQKAMRINRKM